MEAPRDENFVPAALFEIDGQPGEVMPGQIDELTGRILVDATGGGGGDVVGPASSTDNAVARFDGTTGKLLQNSTGVVVSDTNQVGILATSNTPTHSLTLGSTGTGIAIYNTSDQTTNYERLLIDANSNTFRIIPQNGGSGTSRAVVIGTSDKITVSTTNINMGYSTSGTGGTLVTVNGTQSQSSGTTTAFAISPTISQSSTAAYTGLLINPTESSTGSGAKNLILAQVGGVEKLSVANTGITTITNITDQASNQVLLLQGDRATPAANDEVYESFYLSSSTGVQREFARITAIGTTVTNASEVGSFKFGTTSSGTLASRMTLDNANLRPFTNDLIALGSATTSWSDLFLASGAVINFNNGDVTVTHATDNLTIAGGNITHTVSGTGTTLTNPVYQATNSVNNFTQLSIQNKTAGVNSSADLIAYGDNNTDDTTGFADIGYTSSAFSQAAYAVTGQNEAYFFASAPSGAGKTGNMVLATDSTGSSNAIKMFTGGFNSTSNLRLTVSSTSAAFAVNAVPNTNDGSALGTSSLSWSDLFLASGAVINIANGNWTATHTSTTLTIGSGMDLRLTTAGTNSTSVLTVAGSQTVTTKRIQPRSSTSATGDISPDLTSANVYQRTALSAGITINAPTGTPVLGEVIVFMLKDNGSSRSLTWNATYKALGTALPSATTTSKRTLVTVQYDGTDWLAVFATEV